MTNSNLLEDTASSTKKNKKKTEKFKLKVNPRFIITSLRSVGYDPLSALSELLDNSIDATAKNVIINKKDDVITISDDGCGMSYKTLKASLDFGCEREYLTSDIGYFGAGLKTSSLNLINVNNPIPSTIEIITFNGKETSRSIWTPIKGIFDGEIEIIENIYENTGTHIKITGSVNFNLKPLKKNIGVVFYNILKNNIVNIVVDGEKIIGIDPLYRNDPKTKTNFLYATVKGHEIKIEAVSIDTHCEKTSWDEQTMNLSKAKSGTYVVYGGRYIETGGSCGVMTDHNSNNYTRMEFTIPKELTEEFKINFNKTKGLNIAAIDALDNLKREIKLAFKWGVEQRTGSEKITEEDIKILEDITKDLNKAGNNIKLAKFKDKKKNEVDSETIPVSTEPKTDKDHKIEPDSVKPRIKENKIFDIRTRNLDNFSKFWNINVENGVLVITLNTGHSFYKDIYMQMDRKNAGHLFSMLGAMAYAQYETMKNETIDGKQIEDFWDDYWSTVSTRLRQFMSN